MEKFAISADPHHQQYVPIERCRLAARVAEELLGVDRVQVRWMDWLRDGFDTDKLSPGRRTEIFSQYASGGRDRFNGRAVSMLAENLLCKSVRELDDNPCKESLLRSRHVHVDPAGRIMPGTCAGIVLGTADEEKDVATIWRRLDDEHGDRPILSVLAERGPVGLLEMARSEGFEPREGYAGKCHLCWDIRRHLACKCKFTEVLAPTWMYLNGRA